MRTIYVRGSRRTKVNSSDVEMAPGEHFQVILTDDPLVIGLCALTASTASLLGFCIMIVAFENKLFHAPVC